MKTQAKINWADPDRRLRWISSFDAKNGDLRILGDLQAKMQDYYSQFEEYYDEISYGQDCWSNNQQPLYKDILKLAQKKQHILEVGCGQAGILTTGEIDPRVYTGLDFSESLIKRNRSLFPNANFVKIKDSLYLPFENDTFEMVFSLFVIEHSVFPWQLLLEQIRVLKPGGIFCLLCPNFLGSGSMTSQRKGFSPGIGSQKLKRGDLIDAFVSVFDARLRIPFICRLYRRRALKSPKFYINIRPVCFVDPFIPDVDAVYLTFQPEIEELLQARINWLPIGDQFDEFCKNNRLIYLKGEKL